ncbi:HK97 gp10 family phage protein [Butyrivibrio sp. AD3002]|uniref:HK97 gp10 family phage protein n=1 Tax=Butyrivibrio sp. AD3002 TaxID=1280670 RepID=UPI0003B688F9|nr:HK97 gp10 family phage protein [Butyrivibrio sp. AD3002]
MSETVKIGELSSKIMAGLKEYEKLATQDMKSAVKKAGQTARKEIAATAPTDTGRYAKSWTVKKTKETGTSMEVTVHSRNRYRIAHLLEHGHAKRGGGKVAARPHIGKAEQKAVKEFERDIEKALKG